MKRDNGSRDDNQDYDDGPSMKVRRNDESHKFLRVLIPSRAAGPIIGKGGETIKKLRSQFSVRLHIPDSRGPERVFYVEGERPNICGCLKELTEVFMDVLTARNADAKLIEGRKDEEGNDLIPEKLLDMRILIHQSQVGSVIGKNGDKIKELREKHHMHIIKIYQELAPGSTDRVLQLIGDPDNVYDCVENVMETLEASPIRGPRSDYDANCSVSEPAPPQAMYDRYAAPPSSAPSYGYDMSYGAPTGYGVPYDDRSGYGRGYDDRRGPSSSSSSQNYSGYGRR